MATTDLSSYNADNMPSAKEMRFGIIVSDWNHKITGALLNAALNTLKKHGTNDKNIIIKRVPGSFELPLGAQFVAEYDDVDAVICLGCVIQGETPHFTYVCQGVTQGIMQLNMEYNIPFVFGLLTTDTEQQAIDRSGGKLGNKGDEAAITAIRMAALQSEMEV